MLAPVLFALFVAQGQGDMAVSASTTLEQRPAAARLSPLQPRVDAAAPGSVIDVAAGTYTGDLYIDRPVRLVGHGRPLLVGSGSGSVVLVRAADVVVEGFDIDGRAGGDLGPQFLDELAAGRGRGSRAVRRDHL